MKRPRVSIAASMGGVLFLAIGLAALKYPTPLGANALGTLLQGSLLVALLGAITRRGPRRAFWIGFVICGGGYTLLAFDLSSEPSARPRLVTVDLLVLLMYAMTGDSASWNLAFSSMTTANQNEWFLFGQTGHLLFALLSGVLGGFLGRTFADRNG